MSRLDHALATRGLTLPETGRIALFGIPEDLASLPKDRLLILTRLAHEHDALVARGYACATEIEGDFAAAIVTLPRARDLSEHWIACAEAAAPDGHVIVDGAKTDGADAMLKAVRQRTDILGQVSKAHGKVFWFAAGNQFADWRRESGTNRDGFLTAPGVFSAAGLDPASRALAEVLPRHLGRTVADLGAGWGYLSARLLERDDIETLHLVEADHAALDCARANVDDTRALFHWADARRWTPDTPLDTVVTNPPFHEGRAADPSLGRAFIDAAARMLAPQGALWLVANRHLPYEATLAESFRDVSEAGGDRRYKILHAARPIRAAAKTARRA